MVGAFFSVLGWLLLGLLCLLLLLLILPVTLSLSYKKEKFVLAVRVLFIKWTLLGKELTPRQEERKRRRREKKKAKKEKKQAKKAEKKPQAKPKEKPKQSKRPKNISETLHLVKKVAAAAGSGTKIIFKMLFVRKVVLVLPVHAEDAAQTAQEYGRAQMLLGSVCGVLNNLLHIRYKQVEVIADFADLYADKLTFSCKIIASPVIMLVAGIVGLKRFLSYDKEARALYIEYGEREKQRRAAARAARKTKNSGSSSAADKKNNP